MCALLAMAVYDTEENKRTMLTWETVYCILETVDLHKHRLVIIDNDSCLKTKEFLEAYNQNGDFTVIESHWGTVRADFIRTLDISIKNEIERIYREEINAGFLPNTFCSGCYLRACKELINHFKL